MTLVSAIRLLDSLQHL